MTVVGGEGRRYMSGESGGGSRCGRGGGIPGPGWLRGPGPHTVAVEAAHLQGAGPPQSARGVRRHGLDNVHLLGHGQGLRVEQAAAAAIRGAHSRPRRSGPGVSKTIMNKINESFII